MKKIFGISLVLIILDQIIKMIVYLYMPLNKANPIIDDFFNLTYVQNEGAAWSILSGNVIFLILIAIIALNLIYFFLIKDQKLNKLEITSYSLIIGGIIGNLIDRIIHGYVIDYLDFKIFAYNFPVFNLADICIVSGTILVIILLIMEEIDGRNKNKRND